MTNRVLLIIIAVLLTIIAGALIVPRFTHCEMEFNTQAVERNEISQTIRQFESQGWKLENQSYLNPAYPNIGPIYLQFSRCKK